MRVQGAIESIIEPLAAGVGGGVLYLLVSMLDMDAFQLSETLLLVCAVWGVAVVVVYRRYVAQLHGALAARRLSGGTLSLADGDSLATVRAGLSSPRVGEVLYCMALLANEPGALSDPDLLALLNHAEAEVRLEAIRLIQTRLPAPPPCDLLELLPGEADAEVREALVLAWAAGLDDDVAGAVAPLVEHEDEAVRLGAYVALLRFGGIEGTLVVGERLLAASANRGQPRARRMAARVLGKVGLNNVYRSLLNLLEDSDADVRRAALEAAGRIKAPALVPAILRNMADPAFEWHAVNALAEMGPVVIAPLAQAFHTANTPKTVRRRIVPILGQMGTEAVPALSGMLDHPARRLNFLVLKALYRCGYRCGQPDDEAFRARLAAHMDNAAYLLACWRDCHDPAAGPTLVEVLRSLAEELWMVEEAIFLIIGMLYPKFDAVGAWGNFRRGTAAKRAYAIEALETLLPANVRAALVPLLDGASLTAKFGSCPAAAVVAPRPRLERLAEMAGQDTSHLLPSTRGCALLALFEAGRTAELATLAHSSDPLVRETAATLSERAQTLAERNPTSMLTIEKILTLRSVSVFADIAKEHLEPLAHTAKTVELAAGETLFSEGDDGNAMFVVVGGRLRVHRGGRTIVELGPREVVGEMAALDPEPRSASVDALEDSLLLRIGNRELEYLLSDDVDIARGVIRVLCQRLRRQTAQEMAATAEPG
jgi:HEAT repeat protein